MKLFVLTCINEDLEIVGQSAFTNILDAQSQMIKEYSDEINELDDDNVVVNEFNSTDAEIAWGEQPYDYRWFIKELEL